MPAIANTRQNLSKAQYQPIVILFGGLGNRLFQIARAWDIQQRGGIPQVIPIENIPELHLVLEKVLGWTRHPMWIDTNSICENIGLKIADPTFTNRMTIYKEFFGLLHQHRKKQFNIPLELDYRSVQIGYFQGERCISKSSVVLLVETLCKVLDFEKQGPEVSVVHIRGGDFNINHRLSGETVESFLLAHPRAICVTNDRAYVSSKHPKLAFSGTNSAQDDFLTIANASYILPSNSTFCFWSCAIAVLTHQAEIWSIPKGEYWSLISSETFTNKKPVSNHA